MFRDMRRIKQQVPDEECKRLLSEKKRAAFSVIGEDGYPYTVPINYYYDETDDRIYFHSARKGHKTDALRKCDKACLTVWNQGYKEEGHWEWEVTSVVVFGRARPVDDESIIEDRLRKLAAKYYPTEDEIEAIMISPSVRHVQLYAIEIEHMTGKLVNEK